MSIIYTTEAYSPPGAKTTVLKKKCPKCNEVYNVAEGTQFDYCPKCASALESVPALSLKEVEAAKLRVAYHFGQENFLGYTETGWIPARNATAAIDGAKNGEWYFTPKAPGAKPDQTEKLYRVDIVATEEDCGGCHNTHCTC